MSGKAVALAAGVVATALLLRRRTSRPLEGAPAWWTSTHPMHKWRRVCHPTKRDALHVFLDANRGLVEDWGGIDAEGSGGEFDAINHKLGLRGKRAVRTIGEAIWAAMPPGRPFCLDRIDLEALNDTSPAQHHPVGFRLPDFVTEQIFDDAEARYFERLRAA